MTAKIKYLGLYRLRETQEIPVILSGKKAAVQDYKTPELKNSDGTPLPNGQGTLEFFIEKIQGDTISGNFRLSHPEDFGDFEIKKGSSNGKGCLVM